MAQTWGNLTRPLGDAPLGASSSAMCGRSSDIVGRGDVGPVRPWMLAVGVAVLDSP